MLYMLGAVTVDTAPFSADDFSRSASADFAEKPVIGSLKPSEFMGEGQEQLSLSGQLLPSRIGGLTELETLDEMRRKGARFPVLRGDGTRLGTYALTQISEDHSSLMRDGVGFIIRYRLQMRKVQSDDGSGQQTVSGILSLFDALLGGS
ncbi:MAG: phage tail protein [Roseibium sp.]|uniref:phage tail protein n=2 Tax=Roseibium sp. TaxID=1936156 RepID=UPI00329848CE